MKLQYNVRICSLLMVLLELDREHRFLDLAAPEFLGTQEKAAGELHGDRRAAESPRAPAGQVPDYRPQDAFGIHSTVLENIAILRREHRLLDQQRNLRPPRASRDAPWRTTRTGCRGGRRSG